MADNTPLDDSSAHRPVPIVTGESFYKYAPLEDENHIRLLVLDPGKNVRARHLSGKLVTVNLKEAPRYEAISYAWGSSDTDKTIFIDGKRLPITTSMAHSLRQTRRSNRRRIVWADSICINQKDDAEKGHQVSSMGRVYQRSERTLICLGLGHGDDDRQHARNVAALIRNINEMMDGVFNDQRFSWEWDSFPHPKEDDPLIVDKRWTSWVEMGKCDWFRRGWVAQEVALAPDAVVLWAGVEIQWSSFPRTYYWFLRRANHLIISRPGSLPRNPAHYNPRSDQLQREVRTLLTKTDKEILTPRKTLKILDFARELEMSEPKDRIYAFMAMPTSDSVMLHGMKLQPDYGRKKSYLDVYREFAVKYLQETSDLDLLSVVEHGDDINNHDDSHTLGSSSSSFPSWVPCWKCGRWAMSLLDETDPKIHSNTAPDVATVRDSSILRVRAVIIDSVEYVSSLPIRSTTHMQPSEAVREVVSLWREVAPKSIRDPGPHESPFHRAEAFLYTVLRGMYEGDQYEFDQCDDAFAAFLENDEPSLSIDTYTDNKSAQRISLLAVQMSRYRRFVLLSRGYFGIAPRATHKDDVCAIIFGTRSPFILRRVTGTKDHYQVVGAANVQCTPGYCKRRECCSDGTCTICLLGWDDDCRDWEEWGLPTEDILLC